MHNILKNIKIIGNVCFKGEQIWLKKKKQDKHAKKKKVCWKEKLFLKPYKAVTTNGFKLQERIQVHFLYSYTVFLNN